MCLWRLRRLSARHSCKAWPMSRGSPFCSIFRRQDYRKILRDERTSGSPAAQGGAIWLHVSGDLGHHIRLGGSTGARVLAMREFEARRLVNLGDAVFDSAAGYWLALPRLAKHHPGLAAFTEWVRAETVALVQQ